MLFFAIFFTFKLFRFYKKMLVFFFWSTATDYNQTIFMILLCKLTQYLFRRNSQQISITFHKVVHFLSKIYMQSTETFNM